MATLDAPWPTKLAPCQLISMLHITLQMPWHNMACSALLHATVPPEHVWQDPPSESSNRQCWAVTQLLITEGGCGM